MTENESNILDNKIYRRLTMNIQNKMAKFKEGKSTKDRLNNQLIINISSLCKFIKKTVEKKVEEEKKREKRKLRKMELETERKKIHKLMLEQEKKENEKNKHKKLKTKKLSEEMQKLKQEKDKIEEKMKQLDKEEEDSQNQTILDVFVPYSRLAKSLKDKLDRINEEIQEEEDEENDLNLDDDQINLDGNQLEGEKFDKLFADEDADEDNDLNNNNEFLNNDNLSISQSFYQKPIGFDEFKNNNDNEFLNNQKEKETSSEKELNKAKQNEIIIPEFSKEDQLKKANEEFKNILKPKEIRDTINEMSYDYMKYMYNLFENMKKKSEETLSENSPNRTLNFINQFKSFILDIGISDKKFYEQCIREIIYNKSELKFGEFLECFKKLVNLKFVQIYLKYKFLLNIVKREDEEYYTEKELEDYYKLIYYCKKQNENEIQEEIKNKLLYKYKKIFPSTKTDKISTRKLSVVLEQFFDIK